MLARLAKQPKALVVAEGLALTGLVASVDYFTSWEVSLAIFYLLPISLVAWGAGRWAGILLSCACAVAWLSIDTLIAPPSSHPSIPYWNSTVRLIFFLIFTLTLSSLKRALDREKELASTDPLTGVRNARSYRESVSAEIERAKRYRHPFSVAYLDLDDFKAVNDRFGHNRGDRLLQLVASTVRSNLRTSDVVARLGGDEFALLLPETDYDSAQAVLRKIQDLLVQRMRRCGFLVTCSIGAVTFPCAPAASVEELIRRADACMYEAKRRGKHRMRHVLIGVPSQAGRHFHGDFRKNRSAR